MYWFTVMITHLVLGRWRCVTGVLLMNFVEQHLCAVALHAEDEVVGIVLQLKITG